MATRPSFDRAPIYAALFRGTLADGAYEPLVSAPLGVTSSVTVPHGLDREVASALSGLWYCLHLPNVFPELFDLPASVLARVKAADLGHHIVLVPIEAFDTEHVGAQLAQGVPVLAVCQDELLDEAIERCSTLGFALPPTAYSDLSDQSLRSHWEDIYGIVSPDAPYLGPGPRLASRLDLAPSDLPRRWLTRQFGGTADVGDEPSPPELPAGETDAILQALWSQTVLSAVAALEAEGLDPRTAEGRMPEEAMNVARDRLRIPLAVSLPGVAQSYVRKAYDAPLRTRIDNPLPAFDPADVWDSRLDQRNDSLVERATIEFLVTHRAIARGGLGVTLPGVPAEAFGVLVQLEEHFRAWNPRGRAVRSLMARLDALMTSVWSDGVVAAIKRASMLTAFTNFPIGLLRLPGDTSPLAARVPIAYRPLLPLTRALQNELSYIPPVDLSGTLKVLVAECIQPDDKVGAMSRRGWTFACENVGPLADALTVDLVETLSTAELRAAIATHKPDVLVLSAHGSLSSDRHTAGLLVGDELVLGPGLGPLPPVVILSACHVAPRGAGSITITDLLLREGAIAVLGAQVPVDVRRNAMLTVRFLVNIAEVLNGGTGHSNLLEIWHRVQSSNAVNDVLNGGRDLAAWATSPGPSGAPVITEFMTNASVGRLRMGHIYADTETVLAEIAAEQGREGQIRNWFTNPGYVPESLFYVFAGHPERVFLRPFSEAMGIPEEEQL